MFYEILKPVVSIFYKVYYRIEFKGIHHFSVNKAIIVSPNHTNGFIDPVVIAANVKPKVRFFARGDVFKGKIVKWLLNDLNISPMFRLQEGYSEIKKNNKSFEECRDLLSRNKAVLIFPEAICVQEKRLQPLKKGLSRIAFQTEESFDFKKNIWVLPIGLNYQQPQKFRSDFFIHIGDPISIGSYEELYKENKVKAINEFTRALEKEMAKLIITINKKHNDELVEGVCEIFLYNWMKGKDKDIRGGSVQKRFKARNEITEMINWADDNSNEVLQEIKEKISLYLKKLKQHNLRDHLFIPQIINQFGVFHFLKEFVILWFGMPVYLIAVAIHGLPLYLAKKIADKKIKQAEFYASFRVNIAMLSWMLFFGFQLVIIGLAFKNWWVIAGYGAVAALLVFHALKYYSEHKKILGRWRLLRMVRKQRNIIEEFVNERAEIIEALTSIKKEYLSAMQ